MVAKQTTLLVVDDDPAITRIYNEVFTAQGYGVLTAGSCAEAMLRLDSVNGEVGAMLIDLGLPDGDGADFARNAVAKYGAHPTLFVSGWSDEFWQLHDAPGRWMIMRKPIPIPKLLAAVKWLVDGGERPKELDEA